MEEDILYIVTRILANEADAKDLLVFNDWISRDEKNRQKYEQLLEYWNMSVEIENAETLQVSFEKFTRRMAASGVKRKLLRSWLLPAAASIALLIGGAFMFHFLRKDQPTAEYYTCNSQNNIFQLILPDSTTVHLNRNSKITYSSEYGTKNRQVELQGEAYFDVRKDDCPFRLSIANSDAVIEVLGTKFNVKANEDESAIVATLEEGSILFRDDRQLVLISPDQQLVYNRNTSSIVLENIDVNLYISWKDHIYRFSRISFRELCAELERIYEVKISVSQKLEDITVSGSFEYRQSIEEVLNAMKKSVSFNWIRERDQIIVNSLSVN